MPHTQYEPIAVASSSVHRPSELSQPSSLAPGVAMQPPAPAMKIVVANWPGMLPGHAQSVPLHVPPLLAHSASSVVEYSENHRVVKLLRSLMPDDVVLTS